MNKLKQKRQKHIIFSSSNFSDTMVSATLIILMIIIILNPKKYTSGTISGIKLFFYSVLPGLFPFMLLTKLLTENGLIQRIFSKADKLTKTLLGTSGVSLFVFFMSIISGYPIGAKIISDLYEKNIISTSEAKKMCTFCTTSGPIFIIGAVGTGMFDNYKFGVIIYISHIISAFIFGIIYNILTKKSAKNDENKYNSPILPQIMQKNQSKNIFSKAVSETVNSVMIVGAYITIFYLAGELFETLGLFSLMVKILSPILKVFGIEKQYCTGIIYGMLEVTRGVKVLSNIKTYSALLISTGIISLSGLSIIFQSMEFLKNAKIKTRTFVFLKFVHSLLSMIICYIFIKTIL